MSTIPLGTRPANPTCAPKSVLSDIPTPFARFHAEMVDCATIADLTDVAMRIAPNQPDSLSVDAQRELFEFANRRFAELCGQEQAA